MQSDDSVEYEKAGQLQNGRIYHRKLYFHNPNSKPGFLYQCKSIKSIQLATASLYCVNLTPELAMYIHPYPDVYL